MQAYTVRMLTCITDRSEYHLGSGTLQSLLAPVVDSLDGQGVGRSGEQRLQPELTLGLEEENPTALGHSIKHTHTNTGMYAH